MVRRETACFVWLVVILHRADHRKRRGVWPSVTIMVTVISPPSGDSILAQPFRSTNLIFRPEQQKSCIVNRKLYVPDHSRNRKGMSQYNLPHNPAKGTMPHFRMTSTYIPLSNCLVRAGTARIQRKRARPLREHKQEPSGDCEV